MSAQSVAPSSAVIKRLQSELMALMMAKPDGISAFPQPDNMLHWVGTITGADDTAYAGLHYKLTLKFPTDYPFTAPTISFDTPCWHPNVDDRGNICLDILKDKWSAIYNVQSILLSLQTLLGDPNTASPLNGQAAQLWDSPDEYKRFLLKHYKEHAA
ncbi:Ubiquitin-conjugating enzyme E2 11 [Coemansia sp. RSA 2523]|nr:Ubiquitin-conjugating enzyme E2 11 [Coemansia sp. RSA 1824]KAJ1792658.1 Ubiquitin-conjugating enzyme E2 11 [Coemansia sp. RSA 2167]KAJ1806700.1 Ubiquitin-conjugating enzyme E2 11 [Coemansia sp. RSA 2523]KAJ2132646.1 Ubiquitin-conjugating enzyme E2 11 [Coemansia sp. RSA 921]KAJ2141880.1 Ubiquitin-conjugating enzyme E2 11 [Coemansia sp. RSA 564]KAJ2152586.1 Ubiquitin-conjugating enzyme E2 11 [Coemansia sp. RSA 637]KAJ2165677.1 Ubiquitin-conjugating enzyme E2 11 [Coemansia sp. RSA 562]KAJ217